MVRHTLKILLQLLQDFKSVSDHFGTLYIKQLNYFARFYRIIREDYSRRCHVSKMELSAKIDIGFHALKKKKRNTFIIKVRT